MAYVTTGKTGGTATVVLVCGEEEDQPDHLTPGEARALGVKLIEAAYTIEQPGQEWRCIDKQTNEISA